MIKDRRFSDRYIPINFYPKETFQLYPSSTCLTLTLVTDGIWDIELNGQSFHLDAPFIFCLNASDRINVTFNQRATAKTFIFNTTFLNSSLTPNNIFNNAFKSMEDMHDYNLIQAFLRRNENYSGLITLNAPSAMQINTWLSVIGSECLSQSDVKWTCRIRRYLLQILYLLEDEFIQCYEHKANHKTPIDYALEYIHSNYHLGLTLDGICKYVGLNRTSLNKHCKQKTGMTIIQYLNHYRIKMAEEALIHTNLNLNELAICCGFNYESYFIKIFSEKKGISPSEYRRTQFSRK